MSSPDASQVLAELLGLDTGCNLSLWSLGPYATLLALFASVCVRYRGAVFFWYYEKRNTRPTRYCTITTYPYEAIIAFLLLAGPRIIWTYNATMSAIDSGAWESRDLSNSWAWVFVGYFFLVEIFEMVMFRRRILARYYEMKSQRSIEIVRVDEAAPLETEKQPLLSTDADEEAATAPPAVDATAEPVVRPSIRVRFTKLFTRLPQPTAVNVLSQLHTTTFIKGMLVFLLLHNITIQFCLADGGDPKDFFNLDYSIVPQCIIISSWLTIRFVDLLIKGVRFGQREVDFAELNGREGRVEL